MYERPMVHIRWFGDEISFQESYSVGTGRYRRRELGRYRSLTLRPEESVADLLRRAADAMEGRPFYWDPAARRWSREPRGAVGGS